MLRSDIFLQHLLFRTEYKVNILYTLIRKLHGFSLNPLQ